MEPKVAALLTEINRKFYSHYGESFASTRRRIQPGARRVLNSLPDEPGERWLDLGCGSGALALEWLRAGRESAYHGIDFSATLLQEAQVLLEQECGVPVEGPISFGTVDLTQPDWSNGLAPGWTGILSFAVLHHLPGHKRRVEFARRVRELLVPGGRLIFSVWQFQHSEKLMARRLPWSMVGLREEDLEPGDTLLDWRAADPAAPTEPALRYVHLFSHETLAQLAEESDFRTVESFESDGHGGRLGLYQVWSRD